MGRSCVGVPLIFAMSSAPAIPAAYTEAASGIPSEDELAELNGLMQEDEAELRDEDPFGHALDNAHAPVDLHWPQLAKRGRCVASLAGYVRRRCLCSVSRPQSRMSWMS